MLEQILENELRNSLALENLKVVAHENDEAIQDVGIQLDQLVHILSAQQVEVENNLQEVTIVEETEIQVEKPKFECQPYHSILFHHADDKDKMLASLENIDDILELDSSP